jgi:Flp pilus assembly pilin Flp
MGLDMKSLVRFRREERGLVTIEWVAVGAVALLAAVAISALVLNGADRLGGAVANNMRDAADTIDPP